MMTKKEIETILNKLGIMNFSIDDMGYVSVEGDVEIIGFKLEEIPVKFHKIYGNFSVSGNRLITLKNCPDIIYGVANFSYNQLIDMKYCTPEITGSLLVNGNRLKTLRGCPEKIGACFSCEVNEDLKSIKYAPISTCVFDKGSGIPYEEVEIYTECIKRNLWEPTKTIKYNLSKLLKSDPDLVSNKWGLITKLKEMKTFNSLSNLNF